MSRLSIFIILFVTSSAWGNSSHNPEEFIARVSGTPDAGKQIYGQFCVSCHAKDPMISLGAPRFRDKADWQARNKKGIDAMLANIANGFNAMPARGGCFECSDDDLKAAIKYMQTS